MDIDNKPELEHTQIADTGSEGIPMTFNPKEERQLIWKCDLHVVPILMLLYLLAFLDRINIGNARLQGLERDLQMKGTQYNHALFIFFIPYVLCEIPCNLIMKKLAPSTWISGIMVGWGMSICGLPGSSSEILIIRAYLGIVTIGQGFVQTWSGLMACRFLIGVLEAGFLPGKVPIPFE